MSDNLQGMKRSHYCAHVTEKLAGQEVCVMGWVNKRRDLGKLIFIALRDRTGLVQITIDGNKADKDLFEKAEKIRGEFVLGIKGIVNERTPENVNLNMETGKIEIEATELRIFSEAEVPPFSVMDEGVSNDLRLKYRYLDLRRPELQKNMFLRHKIAKIFREFLDENGFVDTETPMLTKSTPEGARDYLVPSRMHPGNFYALPQSPQMFKQLLMVSGFDKYYQIVKCFRDEDLRADRQPEFTQVDIEMSFVEREDIFEINEKLWQKIFKECLNIDLPLPLQRMSYYDAMNRFGSDKPDTRFGMEIKDITQIVGGSEFMAFQGAIDAGGSVRGINAEKCASFSRKQIDALVEFVKGYKAKGLAWITLTESGEVKTSLTKFFDENKINEIINAFGAKAGDLILICADKTSVALDALGALRLEVAKKSNIIPNDVYNILWVTDFPLLEYSEEDNRYYAKHHPFTSPMDEDLSLLDTAPEKVRAKAYDLVINGMEAGGGSIRIFNNKVQERMFNILGFTNEQAYENFGFLLEAFKYGVPPHGGIAYGLDRIAMIVAKCDSIRDVIAFPKVKDASCPLTDAPGEVPETLLKELGISVDLK